jgi:acyl carrier protein
VSTDMARDENTIINEITPLFREIFDDPALIITSQTMARDVDGWDSLTHMSLILAVEGRYKIKFGLGDIVKFRNVGDMCRVVLKLHG